MALRSGFFNALNHDRLYDAEAVSRIFDGVIADGVYTSIGECFTVSVSPDVGTDIIVKSGRAWFHHTWTFLDEAMVLHLPASDILYDRIDTVILKIDSSFPARQNTIEVKTGTPSSNPEPAILTHADFINEYPLARIRRSAAHSAITQSDITNTVGTSECPFVKGIVETVSTDILLQQWQADFQTWFDHMKDQIDDDLGMHLQQEIELLDQKFRAINDKLYPVGSIYTTTDASFDPNVSFGGTWELLKDKFLVGAGEKYEVGDTGGEETHKLMVQEMPSHTHTQRARIPNGASAGQYTGTADSTQWYSMLSIDETGATGGDQPHNNLPPYQAVNMWLRTA